MSNTFLNWESNFKNKFPYSGMVYIDITGGFINCKLFYHRPQPIVYLPFIYCISNYKFNIEACEY